MFYAHFTQVNFVYLSGVLCELFVPRYTPAGISVVEGTLRHTSSKSECESLLAVSVDVRFVVVGGDFDKKVTPSCIGKGVILEGFWGAHGIYRSPVLHVNSFWFFCDKE